MFSKKHIINLLSIVIILFIDSIYMLIYSPKSFLNPVVTSISYLLLFIFIIRSVVTLDIFNNKIFNKNSLTIFLFLVSIVLSFVVFNSSGLLFIDKYLSAKLKLLDMNYNMNSMQISDHFLYNFYSVNVFSRLLGMAGLILVCLFFIKNSTNIKTAFLKMVILLFSPLIYTVIIIRGEFLFIIALSMILMIMMEKTERENKGVYIILLEACLAGVLLFLNLSAVVLIIVYSFYSFRNDLIKAFGFILLAAIVLLLLITVSGYTLPYNELSGVRWFLIGFCIISVYLGWSVSSINEVFFASGILIFLMLSGIVLIDITTVGISKEHIRIYSLNLLQYCLPVLLLLVPVNEYKVDRFLGKTLSGI